MTPDAYFRLVRSGEWKVLLPGIVVVAGVSVGWEQQLAALQLWIPREGALSHGSAGALLRFPGCPPGALEVTVPGKKNPPPRSQVAVHCSKDLQSIDIVKVDGFRVTSPTRTLLDLAGRLGPDALERAIEDCLRRHLTSVAKLQWMLRTRGGKGRPGTAALRRILELYETAPDTHFGSGPTQSDFESDLFALLRRSGLPLPVKQHEVWHEGRLLGRLDLAYPHVKLAIEADSYTWHTGRSDWRRNTVKWNELVKIGWRVYKTTPEDVRFQPATVVADVRGLLGYGQLSL